MKEWKGLWLENGMPDTPLMDYEILAMAVLLLGGGDDRIVQGEAPRVVAGWLALQGFGRLIRPCYG
jgi:hypothetical protein